MYARINGLDSDNRHQSGAGDHPGHSRGRSERLNPDAAEEPVRVFLIEDHQVVREGTRRLLEYDGDAVVIGEADSGEDALNSPALSLAQVVMCDVVLPGINGIETTREVVARYPTLKVVMLSAFGDDYLEQALEAGASGYILKRATQAELVRAVQEAASGGSPMSPSLSAVLVGRFRELQHRQADDRLDLTSRQREVMKLVAEGRTTRDVASTMYISPATVKRELRHVFERLGAGNRAHAVAEAQRRKLI
ncbi:MAG: response regulator transcription factor [Chloroflexi bacterium]|nr:response regulator transcription factor [Chloroflexota bacterium]